MDEMFLLEDVSKDAVLDAMKNTYKVRIRYDDEDEEINNSKKSRVIHPFALGTTKNGHLVTRAFQENGGSRRGAPNWKFFRLDRIKSWTPLKNKHFTEEPPIEYGEYNKSGDKSMLTFFDNVKFDDFISPLDRAKNSVFKNDVKVGKKALNGPLQPRVTQQWKKNVYTSQPNSKKYDYIRQNIDRETPKDDDFWKLFDLNDAEDAIMNKQNGPVDTQYDDSYDEEEIDFDNLY